MTQQNDDSPEKIQQQLLEQAEERDVAPWTIVEDIRDNSEWEFEEIRQELRTLMWDEELRVKADGKIDISRRQL